MLLTGNQARIFELLLKRHPQAVAIPQFYAALWSDYAGPPPSLRHFYVLMSQLRARITPTGVVVRSNWAGLYRLVYADGARTAAAVGAAAD